MDLTVRQPTNQELIAVAGDPKIRAMTNAIARAHEKWDQRARNGGDGRQGQLRKRKRTGNSHQR